jgi:Tol biopolymer transport system component
LYLAADKDDAALSIYGLDLERRIPHRLSNGVDRYTSLAASSDGRRVLATADNPRTSLWRVSLSDRPAEASAAHKIALPNTQGRSPRLARDYLLYVASNGAADGVWRLVNGAATELWTSSSARVVGGPAANPNGDRIAFLIEDLGKRHLVVMNADGTGARAVGEPRDFRGAPAWSPDGESIVTAVNEAGKPHLFRVSVNSGTAIRVTDDYALDPAWSPTGGFLVYSGMDIGTTFPLKSITDAGQPHDIPELTLIRGARRFRFLPGQDTLIVLRGDIEHKNLWTLDLSSGAERQVTNFDRSMLIGDFDVSPDGRELVFERAQENSDVVLIDLPIR